MLPQKYGKISLKYNNGNNSYDGTKVNTVYKNRLLLGSLPKNSNTTKGIDTDYNVKYETIKLKNIVYLH